MKDGTANRAPVQGRVVVRQAEGVRGARAVRGRRTELAQGGQTTVTVQPARPVTFARTLGKPAQARTFRFYAAGPGHRRRAARLRAAEHHEDEQETTS